MSTQSPVWPPSDLDKEYDGRYTKIKYAPFGLKSILDHTVYDENKQSRGKVSDIVIPVTIISLILHFFSPTNFFLFLAAALFVGGLTLISIIKFQLKADKTQGKRNRFLHRNLYDAFKSNQMASDMLSKAVFDGKVDLYVGDDESALGRVKDFIVSEEKVGQSQCSAGHSNMCYHRLPVETTTWLLNA